MHSKRLDSQYCRNATEVFTEYIVKGDINWTFWKRGPSREGWIQCLMDHTDHLWFSAVNSEQEVQSSWWSRTFILNSKLNKRGQYKSITLNCLAVMTPCFIILYLPSLPHSIVSDLLLLMLWLTSCDKEVQTLLPVFSMNMCIFACSDICRNLRL